jgi:hypothetical protein
VHNQVRSDVRINPELHRVETIVDGVKCPPYEFDVWQIDQNYYGLYARLWRQDTNTGEWGWGRGGLHIIESSGQVDSPSVSAIVKRCFVAARDYSEHEVREAFTYNGRRVLDPHQSIESLWEISRDV